ncbi:MAG: FtsW/RodA/SpoVE family cell cycle protein [Bacteroidales bacterium]|jgi:cell division protein FtsW|nr:FtsW/RodA/SpoVE family cell cycle protein [Bacteroidales bacterium]
MMNNFFNRFFKGDTIIWSIIVMLAITSIIEVYSSTGTLAFKYQDGNTSYYILKHTSFLFLGFAVIWAVHNIHYKFFGYLAVLLLPLSVFLLGLTLVTGSSINEASRWLTIPVLGLTFQPSELAKLTLIVFVARKLSQNQSEDHPPKNAFRPIMIWTGAICGLIAPEDLSTAILIGAIVMLMMFIGRVPYKYLFGTIGTGIGLFVLILLIAPRFEDVNVFHRANVWRTRIETFSDTENASTDDSYQSDQAKIAVSTGGIFGKFFGNSRQSNYLPHPYSDFIFAIIIEEGGMIAGIFIIFLYIILLYRAVSTAGRCKTSFPLFLITGLTSALVLQAFAHIFVCVGILPVTGQTLPFVSMGGTSLILTSLSLGMILSVTQYATTRKDEKPDEDFEPNEEMNQEHDLQNV